MFCWDSTACAGDWGIGSGINTKQSFAYRNLEILYLLSVRVRGDYSAEFDGGISHEKLCLWLSYQPGWGMSLRAVSRPTPSPDGEGRAGRAEASLIISKEVFCLFLCFLQARLNCKHCGKPVIDVRIGMQYFSEYSNVQQCPHCGNLDYHFVKPFSSFKVLEAYWRKLCFSNSYFMGISTLLHIFL